MHRGGYWLDRALIIMAALTACGLIILVLNLDTTQRGDSFTRGTLGYAIGLALLALVSALLFDWVRQLPWQQELQTAVNEGRSPQGAVTREQQAMQSVLQEQHRLYQDMLTHYREQQELQQHFQSRWAHQMKTPLAVLDLLLQQWEVGEVSATELTTNLQEVRDKFSAGLEMMLYNTRLSQFELDFVAQEIDLPALLRETINDKKAAFIRYRVFPKLIGQPGPVQVATDPKWLRFVLEQIVNNALKYSCQPEGSAATLEFCINCSDKQVELACRDSGIGIPSQDLERVWQPFFTGANGRRFPEATGMGLYLAKRVCDHLGHGIGIRSQVNVGTTVTLTFIRQDHLYRIAQTRVDNDEQNRGVKSGQ